MNLDTKIFGFSAKAITYIVIGAVILIVVGALVWYSYSQGKKKVSIQSLPGELPGNPGSGNVAGASNDEIKELANDLHSDMDGFNWNGHDMEPYQRALSLGDTDLVKLYNTFNSLYQKDSKQTLVQWMDNEKYYNSEVTDTLLRRFAKLNLK